MIEIGQVTKVLVDEPKLYVRVPIFEYSSSNQEVIMPCRIVYQPGSIGGYNVGDVVLVDCINSDWDAPLVVGKLYSGTEDKPSTSLQVQSINVSGKTVLSADTKIGDITYEHLIDLVAKVDLLDTKTSDALRAAEITNKILHNTESGVSSNTLPNQYYMDKNQLEQDIKASKKDVNNQIAEVNNSIAGINQKIGDMTQLQVEGKDPTNIIKEILSIQAQLKQLTQSIEAICYVAVEYPSAKLILNGAGTGMMIGLSYSNPNKKDTRAEYEVVITGHELLNNPIVNGLVSPLEDAKVIQLKIEEDVKSKVSRINNRSGHTLIAKRNYKSATLSNDDVIYGEGKHNINSYDQIENNKPISTYSTGKFATIKNGPSTIKDTDNKTDVNTSEWKWVPQGVVVRSTILDGTENAALGISEKITIPVINEQNPLITIQTSTDENTGQTKTEVSGKYPEKWEPLTELTITNMRVENIYSWESTLGMETSDLANFNYDSLYGKYLKFTLKKTNTGPSADSNIVHFLYRIDFEVSPDSTSPITYSMYGRTDAYINAEYTNLQWDLIGMIMCSDNTDPKSYPGYSIRQMLGIDDIYTPNYKYKLYNNASCRVMNITLESYVADVNGVQLSPSTLSFNKFAGDFSNIINHRYFTPVTLTTQEKDKYLDDNGEIKTDIPIEIPNIDILATDGKLTKVEDIILDEEKSYIKVSNENWLSVVLCIKNQNIVYHTPKLTTETDSETGNIISEKDENLSNSLFKNMLKNAKLKFTLSRWYDGKQAYYNSSYTEWNPTYTETFDPIKDNENMDKNPTTPWALEASEINMYGTRYSEYKTMEDYMKNTGKGQYQSSQELKFEIPKHVAFTRGGSAETNEDNYNINLDKIRITNLSIIYPSENNEPKSSTPTSMTKDTYLICK